MTWTVGKDRMHLPFIKSGQEREGEQAHGVLKLPGDKITKAEMDEAQQDESSIAGLIKSGAITEDVK